MCLYVAHYLWISTQPKSSGLLVVLNELTVRNFPAYNPHCIYPPKQVMCLLFCPSNAAQAYESHPHKPRVKFYT